MKQIIGNIYFLNSRNSQGFGDLHLIESGSN